MWYAEVIEEHVCIIHRCISILGSDVTDCDSRERLVSFQISNLDNEWMRSVRCKISFR